MIIEFDYEGVRHTFPGKEEWEGKLFDNTIYNEIKDIIVEKFPSVNRKRLHGKVPRS